MNTDSSSKTTLRLSDQAKVNIETIRAHVGNLTQQAAIETSLAYCAALLATAAKTQPKQKAHAARPA